MKRAGNLIVGIGSPHGDDVIGWKVADVLMNDLEQVDVRVEKATSPIQTIDWMEDVEQLIICDACRGLGEPGEMTRWLWPAPELVSVSWSGTHDISLTASLQLAERLDRIPPHVVIWTVEAATGNPLDVMSSAVSVTVPRLARLIANEVLRFPNVDGEACTNNHS